jgi:dTDP-4-dehydrorhamnose 3,5-epimerase
VKFLDAGIDGAFLVDQERHHDERGYFARTFCAADFTEAGLDAAVSQISVSFNAELHTLRGMHLQLAPHAETKLVRCTAGRIVDVLVDLRVDSDSFGRWVAHELDAAQGRAMYVPAGVAHGFLTLEPRCEVLYQISVPYVPESSTGLRWDDPDIGIDWPAVPHVVSERDRTLPDLASLRRRIAG